MAWIESHQELVNHPKAKRFKRKLNVSEHEAVGILHYFWWWALDFAQDGDITDFTPDDVADGCRYNGDSKLFLESLIESGFVDEVEGRLMLHEWMQYGGKLIAWRVSNAEKQKAYRDRNRNKQDNKGNVTVTDESRDYDEGGYVPEVTVTVTEKNIITTREVQIQILNLYCSLHNKLDIHIKTKDREQMMKLASSEIPLDFIMDTMQKVFKSRGEQIHGFGYYSPIIEDAWKNQLNPSIYQSGTSYAGKEKICLPDLEPMTEEDWNR